LKPTTQGDKSRDFVAGPFAVEGCRVGASSLVVGIAG
jgi:hypothetical protein